LCDFKLSCWNIERSSSIKTTLDSDKNETVF